jgi:threonine/homoserine/homoserine lactone efflux protein
VFEYLLLGGGFAFAAAIQPGPLQAFLLSSVAQKGWRRTLPASFSPLLSDGPIALLVLLVLNRMPEILSRILQAAGGIFLIYLAWASYRQWKQQTTTETGASDSAPRTLLQAATVNILNPNPYLGWSLVMGPAVLTAWQQNPTYAVALILAFYTTMVTVLASTILLFGTTRFLGPGGRRTLILVSAVTLAALGVYQLAASLLRAGAV